jgi:hypothetical protein
MTLKVTLEDESFVGLDPRGGGRERETVRVLAERKDTLEGAVLGLVVNGLQEEMMTALGNEVARRLGARRVLKVVKQGLSVPPEPEDWRRLVRDAQAVITGYGG